LRISGKILRLFYLIFKWKGLGRWGKGKKEGMLAPRPCLFCPLPLRKA